jgi:quinohemoprotein ethanol dehydrogenase
LQAYRGLEATPIVVGNVMYVTGNWGRVYAFEATNGRLLWSYDPEVPGEWARYGCCDIVNRGVAVWRDRVFVGTFDGRLVSLDSRTGAVVWEINTIDRARPYTITGAPRVVRNKVTIGNGGAEFGVRGYVTAYDARSGAHVWRFYTVPGGPDGPFEHPELEAAAKTWSEEGEWLKTGGGGTVWDSMAYDPELNLLYVGTGNGDPHARHIRSPRGGDNLFLSSILALNAETGRLVWYYQTTPADSWDFTATQSIILADLEMDGVVRKVLMQAPKNGFFYVLDRATGELLSAEKYVTVNWASRVDLETGRPIETGQGDFSQQDRLVYPSELGGHNWHPMAFSPKTQLAYIPALEMPWVHSPTDFYLFEIDVPHLTKLRRGQPVVDHGGYLRAWDPIRQQRAWEVKLPALINGGVLVTAADLVFQGTQDGYLQVYDATNGRQLHSVFVGVGIIAPPITYAVNGTQYLAVVAGFGGGTHFMLAESAAARRYQNDGRIIVLKLDGGPVPLPPKLPSRDERPTALAQDSFSDVDRGKALYVRHCGFCHGMSGSVPLLPDLQRVPEMGYEAFRAIVLDGAMAPRGMASFSDVLSETETQLLFRTIAAGAHNSPGAQPTP